MNAPKRISLGIESRLDCVSLVGVGILALCRDHGMDEMASYQVQTAVTEAINNAIIHAYANQPDQPVTIDWILQDHEICIEVTDQGKPMEQMPPYVQPAPDAESGRGWWIIRQWMDSAEYTSSDGVNRVTLRRKI